VQRFDHVEQQYSRQPWPGHDDVGQVCSSQYHVNIKFAEAKITQIYMNGSVTSETM
jgi:hypothetical protein